MYQSTTAFPNPLSSIASSSVSGTYQVVGTAFTYPVRILRIVNNSTQDVTVSFDGGATDHDYVPLGKEVTYSFGAGRGNAAPCLDLPAKTAVMVKGTAGTGNIYVIGWSAVSRVTSTS